MTTLLKSQITKNMNVLAENTIYHNKLLNRLLRFGVLDSSAYDKIRNVSSNTYGKNTQMYLEILKTEGASHKQFIECLRDSGNAHLVGKLIPDTKDIEYGLREDNYYFRLETQTEFYVGRENEMKRIEKIWEDCLVRKKLSFVVITGLGGIGKSELAKYAANKFKEKTSDLYCVRMNAETSESILFSLQMLAFDLEVPLLDLTGNEKSLTALIQDVYKKFSKRKCLIILDNMKSYDELILKVLVEISTKQRPKEFRPLIIITSQCSSVSEKFGNRAEQIHLEMLPLKDAEEMVRKSLILKNKNKDNGEDIRKICQRLECFPMALNQINLEDSQPHFRDHSIQQALEEYLMTMNTDTEIDLNFQENVIPETLISIYSNWKENWDDMRKRQPLGETAWNLLKITSLFAPENISIDLLQEILSSFPNPQILEESYTDKSAFNVLNDHSLCKLDKQKGLISINKLVQEVMRLYLKVEGSIIETIDITIAVLDKIYCAGKLPPDQIIHCQVALNFAREHSRLMAKYGNLTF